ncbi:hypothetical protein [Falsiroseomonas selenitidurans]|uniref:CobQ/CobB/MinD/ParA nucleotide binding domain-containing protein n=1 Tax=Falsiroseomonas selenitidurans TaxID=2716335 RepID=A0ABX1EES0_9PROT|nr:hypothetical protein [Falsiroseomonas selenitidurans]NKC33400.1 hypothetical protein [Falsiroseomonas selenitidurans]
MTAGVMKLKAGEVVLVGSDRGGVGKTMTAELVATRIECHGITPVVVEVEAEPRLREVLGEAMVRSLRIASHGPEELERDPALLYEVWEELGDIILGADAPVVVDLGANLTKALAAYLAEVGTEGPFGSGETLWFLGITGGDRFSLSSVNHGLSYMQQAVPRSHRWLVINEQNPRFQIGTDSEPVQAMVRAHRLEGVMRLQACTAPVLQTVVDESQRLADAAVREAAYWSAKGYGQSESRRAVRRLRAFLAEATAMLDPIFPPLKPAENVA